MGCGKPSNSKLASEKMRPKPPPEKKEDEEKKEESAEEKSEKSKKSEEQNEEKNEEEKPVESKNEEEKKEAEQEAGDPQAKEEGKEEGKEENKQNADVLVEEHAGHERKVDPEENAEQAKADNNDAVVQVAEAGAEIEAKELEKQEKQEEQNEQKEIKVEEPAKPAEPIEEPKVEQVKEDPAKLLAELGYKLPPIPDEENIDPPNEIHSIKMQGTTPAAGEVAKKIERKKEEKEKPNVKLDENRNPADY